MNNQEDYIENLFKDNEHLLEERPSRRAWEKLEGKLDTEKVVSSRRIYRYISTAAAVVAIVAMISAIALFKDSDGLVSQTETNEQAIAMREQQNKNLTITNDNSDWRKEYAPKEEVEKIESAEVTDNEETSEVEKKKETRPVIAFNVEEEETPKPVQEMSKSRQKSKKVTSSPTVSKPSSTSSTEKAEVYEVVETSTTPAPVTEEVVVPPEEEGISKDWTLSEDVAIVEEAEKEYKESVERSHEESNVSKKTKRKGMRKVTTINDFKWLEGAWSDNTTQGLSYEKWIATDENTLTAQGYLIQKGDTLFIEKMEIKDIEGKVYYLANFGEGKTPKKFELVSCIDGIAIFESQASASSDKIILTKEGKSNFTITFQEAISSPKLQYRNNTSNARASRRMSRAYKK